MAVLESAVRRASERKLFLIAAILFPLLVILGFARTYYLRGLFDAAPLASMLVHAHGVVMTLWVGLFVTQIFLIRTRNVKLHMSLGLAGVALAILVFVVGMTVSIAQAQRGISPDPGLSPLAFFAVPFFDILLFPIFFGAAMFYRKRPAEHKRLMLLTAINFLPPAVARIPIDSLAAYGPLWFFGVPDLIALICLGWDTWRHGKVNKAFLAGIVLLIASHPLRLVLSGTEGWTRFAAWLTGLAA